MSTHFTVDANELRQMAIQTFNLYYELDDRELPRDGLDGIAGSSAVQDAYGGFVGNWSDGLFYARDHLNKLAQRLSDAANAYGQTESHIAQAAGGSGAGSGQ